MVPVRHLLPGRQLRRLLPAYAGILRSKRKCAGSENLRWLLRCLFVSSRRSAFATSGPHTRIRPEIDCHRPHWLSEPARQQECLSAFSVVKPSGETFHLHIDSASKALRPNETVAVEWITFTTSVESCSPERTRGRNPTTGCNTAQRLHHHHSGLLLHFRGLVWLEGQPTWRPNTILRHTAAHRG